MRIITNTKIAQQLYPGGVWGSRLRNKSVKNVWGLRPHTFFTFLLRNLGLRTPSGHNVFTILIFVLLFHLFPGLPGGVDYYNTNTNVGFGLRLQEPEGVFLPTLRGMRLCSVFTWFPLDGMVLG
jgi:hypothetical protein